MSIFNNKKITEYTVKQESITHSTENVPEKHQMTHFLNKEFKTIVLKMCKEVKSDVDKIKKIIYEKMEISIKKKK